MHRTPSPVHGLVLPARPLRVVLHRHGEMSLFEMPISLWWVDLDPEVGLVEEEAALSCIDDGFKFTSRDASWPNAGKGTTGYNPDPGCWLCLSTWWGHAANTRSDIPLGVSVRVFLGETRRPPGL